MFWRFDGGRRVDHVASGAVACEGSLGLTSSAAAELTTVVPPAGLLELEDGGTLPRNLFVPKRRNGINERNVCGAEELCVLPFSHVQLSFAPKEGGKKVKSSQ